MAASRAATTVRHGQAVEGFEAASMHGKKARAKGKNVFLFDPGQESLSFASLCRRCC